MQIVGRRILRVLLFLLIFAILRGGCTVSEWGDIGVDNSEPGIVGNHYEAQVAMGIYGIALGAEKTVDYYTIIRLPGIAGSEVLTSKKMPKGTEIKVVRIQKCTSCWPLSWRRFVVQVISDSSYDEKFVVIDKSRMNIGKTPWWKLVVE